MPPDLSDDPRDGGIVLPRYDGRSILNVPATVCAALGVPPPTDAPPLAPSVLPPALLDGVADVVLLVADGLGWDLLERAVAAERVTAGAAPGRGADGREGAAPSGGAGAAGGSALGSWLEAARRGEPGVAAAPITSVFPSSTMPALATLNTGLPPSRHGLMGWTTYLQELGGAAELARWGPAGAPGSYADAALGGHDPKAFFGRPTLHRHLRRHGVEPTVILPVGFRGSGFSEMILDGADFSGYYATSTIPLLVKHALRWAEPADGRRRFAYAYWSTVDTVAHHARRSWSGLGADAAALPDVLEEIATLDAALGRHFRPGGRDGRTLLLVTADHGHVFGPARRAVRLHADETLLASLRCAPTGERRLAYLHARPGRAGLVRDYCAERYAEAARVLAPDELFARGLFGPGAPSDAARRRAGDVVLLARDDWQLITAHRAGHEPVVMHGNHGGLDPREMLVPSIAVRV